MSTTLQNRHMALLAVTCGLDPRGFESEAGRRALSQRRAGGHKSAAIRRALSQRRSGGVISRERRAWGSGTRELGNPPAGLGEPPPAADISRDRRAWGLAASGLTPLVAIPPNSHAVLQWAMAGLRAATSLPRDRHKQNRLEQNKTFKNENKMRWMGAYG